MSYTSNMESKKLEILMTALDLGSFIKASEVVGYTQSGITHMMDALEKELGLSLIERSHSGVKLTETGEKLLPYIKEFLKANAKLENKIEELKKEDKKVIRVAAYSSIAMHWMPEILYRFKRICPNVNVELTMVDHALEPFELLEDGKADVIFASKHDYKNINWTSLYMEKLYAILPKDYPLKTKKTFNVKEFNNKEFLMPYGKFDLTINPIIESTNVKPNIISSKVDDETLIRMVSKGLGLSIMSELMIRGRVDDVLCIPLANDYCRELGMATNPKEKDEYIIKLKECVLDYLKK